MCLILPITCIILPLKLRSKIVKITCITANYALTKVGGRACHKKPLAGNLQKPSQFFHHALPLLEIPKLDMSLFRWTLFGPRTDMIPPVPKRPLKSSQGQYGEPAGCGSEALKTAVPCKIIHGRAYFGIPTRRATVYNIHVTPYGAILLTTPYNFLRGKILPLNFGGLKSWGYGQWWLTME